MLRRLMLVAAALALTAAGADVHTTKLTPALLKDDAKVKQILAQLPPAERDLFGKYVIGKVMTDGGFGKPVVTDKGAPPATVGEAISTMKKRLH